MSKIIIYNIVWMLIGAILIMGSESDSYSDGSNEDSVFFIPSLIWFFLWIVGNIYIVVS